MKPFPVAGKFAAVAFASVLLAACAGNDTMESSSTTADSGSSSSDSMSKSTGSTSSGASETDAASAELERLEKAAMAAGNVFYFAFDSSALTRDARRAIDAHIAVLMATESSVRLEGHTDERGTREYNLALGERRANAVRDYMVANGVPGFRIETISYGEENPVVFGSGEDNWKLNRRVELKR